MSTALIVETEQSEFTLLSQLLQAKLNVTESTHITRKELCSVVGWIPETCILHTTKQLTLNVNR